MLTEGQELMLFMPEEADWLGKHVALPVTVQSVIDDGQRFEILIMPAWNSCVPGSPRGISLVYLKEKKQMEIEDKRDAPSLEFCALNVGDVFQTKTGETLVKVRSFTMTGSDHIFTAFNLNTSGFEVVSPEYKVIPVKAKLVIEDE